MMSLRVLHLANPLLRGPDVSAAQALLEKAGYLPHGAVDGVFGPQTAQACVRAKYTLGYPDDQLLPICGATLRGLLSGKLAQSTRYATRAQLRRDQTAGQEHVIRGLIVDYCRWAVANEPQIHYAEVRPMQLLDQLQQLPRTGDCSTFATWAYKYAQAPDPNRQQPAYNGLGYTGTLLNGCRHITKPMALPGDLVVFGPYPGHHVAVLLEPGADPLLASHGSERGPLLIRLSVEAQYQPPGVSWLTVFPLTGGSA